MTEGDYAWFFFTDYATTAILQPWTSTSLYNNSDFNYRLSALYAVKVVGLIVNLFVRNTVSRPASIRKFDVGSSYYN
jgi:hypothetical protein